MLKKLLFTFAIFSLMACSASVEEIQEEEVAGQAEQIEDEYESHPISNLTISDVTEANFNVDQNLLSAEDMALLIENSIQEFFGEPIEGFYLEMALVEPRFDWRIFWIGKIAETNEDLENGNYLYAFRFDAQNGNRLDLSREYVLVLNGFKKENLNEEELDVYKAAVLKYAELFSRGYWREWDSGMFIERMNSENLDDYELKFNLALSHGQELEVVIQRETNQLISFQTFYRQSRSIPRG